jgi:putative SOS response-associated peptidase YedK
MDREKPETGRQSAEMRDELWLRIDRLERLVRWLAMCRRYRRTTQKKSLLAGITSQYHHNGICRSVGTSLRLRAVLAIRLHPETKQRTLDILRWGLIPNWAKDPKIAYKTINARVESVDTAPSYRQASKKRRCLTPSDGFYEW